MEDRSEKRKRSGALAFQMIISLFYTAILGHMTYILITARNDGWFNAMMAYIPQLFILISSMVLQFFLKINHRTHSQEGALPILFSFIALEATMILPDYMAIIDTYAIPAEVFTYMSRFSVLGTAVVFLFASIQFYGTNLSRSWLYLAFALASVVYITFALPLDASSSDAIFSSSDYGDIVIVCYLIINIAAIATYAVSVIKDRATHSPFRSLAYTLLIIGNIMSLGYNPIPSIISVVIYIAGIIIGNNNIPYRKDISSFFDGITWLVQIIMFLILGLLVNPHEMMKTAPVALLIGLFMILAGRPLSVFISLAPFRKISTASKLFTSWVGLRGAAPILFATYPVVENVQGADVIFNVVFFITLLSLIIQGSSIPASARMFKLNEEMPEEENTFGVEVPEEAGKLVEITLTEESLLHGNTLKELKLPEGMLVMMIKRNDKFIVPNGTVELKAGDRLLIISDMENAS